MSESSQWHSACAGSSDAGGNAFYSHRSDSIGLMRCARAAGNHIANNATAFACMDIDYSERARKVAKIDPCDVRIVGAVYDRALQFGHFAKQYMWDLGSNPPEGSCPSCQTVAKVVENIGSHCRRGL